MAIDFYLTTLAGLVPWRANFALKTTPEVREYRVQGIVDNVRVAALSNVGQAVTVP